MSPHSRTCETCGHHTPSGALYCPSCGAATPTEIGRDKGVTAARDSLADLELEDQKQLLQESLGHDFEVRGLVGRGGFASVYAAFDRKLQRLVAVKVLRADLIVSRTLRERFVLEARAAARLRHPNIIPIYQVGEALGLGFYIMPLIEGESLRARLERDERLPVGEAVRILRDVASALSAAHEAGIVHRDIKPDNILLEGKAVRPIVTDFGIAKALTGQGVELTGSGTIIGTPHYMSPEQANGSSDIDARSDLYSLGVVGYQMLSGVLPVDGSSAQEVLVKHLTVRPTPLRNVSQDVPADVAALIDQCLEKDPRLRPPTASGLTEHLAGLLHGKATSSSKVARNPLLQPQIGWRRSLQLGLPILLISAGAAWWYSQQGRLTDQATPSAVKAGGVAEVQAVPPSVSVHAGERTGLLATAFDRVGNVMPTVRMSWKSDNPRVATVDDNGTVIAIRRGTASITASAGGKSSRVTVTVE